MNVPRGEELARVSRMPSISRLMTIGSSHHCFFFHRKPRSSAIVAVLVVAFSRLFNCISFWSKLLGKVFIVFRVRLLTVAFCIFVEFELERGFAGYA